MNDNPAPVEADKELRSVWCKAIFEGDKLILVEKLSPFIPEVIDIQALVDKAVVAARIEELTWVDQNYSNEMFLDWFKDRLNQLNGAKDES